MLTTCRQRNIATVAINFGQLPGLAAGEKRWARLGGRVDVLPACELPKVRKMKWMIVALTLALGGCMGWNPYGGYNDPAEGQLQEEETQKQDKRDDYGQ